MQVDIKTSFDDFVSKHGTNPIVTKFSLEAQQAIFEHMREVAGWGSDGLHERGLREAYTVDDHGNLKWQEFFKSSTELLPEYVSQHQDHPMFEDEYYALYNGGMLNFGD